MRDYRVVQRIGPSWIEYHQVHALIAGRVGIIEYYRNFDEERLTTVPYHLRQARHQVIMRGARELAVEPADTFYIWIPYGSTTLPQV